MSDNHATKAEANVCETRSWVVAASGMDSLFEVLRDRGYAVLGPTVRDGAIVIDEIDGKDDLPIGWRDEQDMVAGIG